MLVFNRFYFLQVGRDCCLGFSISHVTFSEVTSVWGVSAVAVLDCSLNVYACGRQKALSMPAYCVAANCNNSQATQSITMHEFPRNRPAVRRKWVKFVQFKLNELTLMLRLSHAHLCSEHFAECDFVNFMAEYQMGFASKRNFSVVHRVTDLEKIPVQISKDEADEQQAHSMIPVEIYTDTLKQALTRQGQKV